jgi:uncharacterized heparinase superfamily protein
VLDQVDLLLVMSVNPGFGGQGFLHSQLRKVERLRRMIDDAGREIVLEVDGGVNPETARLCVEAGATALVAGTAVFRGGREAYAANIAALKARRDVTRPIPEVAAEHALAGWRLAKQQAGREWRTIRALTGGKGRGPRGLLARPPDLRPVDAEAGSALLQGRFSLAGRTLEVGAEGDPWDRASPSRAFALALHRFEWLPALVAAGEDGARESLRLVLAWERLFGRPDAFSWSAEVLERRVFNLACALGAVLEGATDAETRRLLASLARQAQHLLGEAGPGRAAERATAAAVAGAAFDPGGRDGLLKAALAQLGPALRAAVLADGGHRSRSPERGLELLFDLSALDGALGERGMAVPQPVSSAIDRLRSGLRFFMQPDGRLPAFQGGRAVEAERVRAVLGEPGGRASVDALPHTGYQRLSARTLRVLVDAGPPAEGDWSLEATAHALAVEVMAGTEPLIVASGGGTSAGARLTPAGSTGSVAEGSLGQVLTGWPARGLGPRLVGGLEAVDVRRSADAEFTLWVELSHQGWVAPHAFLQERRLFVDVSADELRGEDRFTPTAGQPTQKPYAVRFHLADGVTAADGPDSRSLRLRTGGGQVWILRSDAEATSVEPASDARAGAIVMRGHVQPQGGARLRWKLSPEAG